MTDRLPPLRGSSLHGGYRLFSVRDLPWDDRTQVSEALAEGRHTVVDSGWGCSRTTGGDLDGKVQLNVYRVPIGPGEIEYHELNGTLYDSRIEATRAAYEAGILSFMVYEDMRIGAQR